MKKYNKEEYIKNKNKELEKLIEDFDKKINEFIEYPDLIMDYFKFAGNFVNYSMNNRILIFLQNPEAKFVAGFNNWKEKGIAVKKGERAIKIYAPLIDIKYINPVTKEAYSYNNIPKNMDKKMLKKETKVYGYKAIPVFADNQTNITRDQYPKLLTVNFENYSDKSYTEILSAATKYLNELGVDVNLSEKMHTLVGGYFSSEKNHIGINEDKINDSKLKTLFHETGHFMLHNNNNEISQSEAEIQAEMMGYLLTKYFTGVESISSKVYIKTWGSQIAPEKRLELMKAVIEACDKVILGVEKNLFFERTKEKQIESKELER
ncbi:ArdC-like ssDNA-binding domain-containing protein [Peptoniphilaceae bacterium SGI.131]